METTEKSIRERVLDVIADNGDVKVDAIKMTDRFREELGFDSLDQVELCMQIERAFNLAVTDAEMEGLTTVADAVGLVEKRMGV